MDITFKGRHTTVPERFRRHATAKLAKLEKLDQRAIRADVESRPISAVLIVCVNC